MNGDVKQPLTAASRFRIGSITKMFTAILIYQLAEENRLNLADNLDRFVPRIPRSRGASGARKGEPTLGYAQYTFNLTQFYTFSGDNWLKGFGLGGTAATGFKYRTYFFNAPDDSRNLYRAPNLTTVNAIVSYARKFKRFRWQTQVNVNNLFNHYLVDILPNNGSGYTNLQNLQATFYGQPRAFVWTNTFSF